MPALAIKNTSSWPHNEVEIIVDGKVQGSVARQDTTEFIVEPGHHFLQVRVGEVHSRTVGSDFAFRDQITFTCRVAGLIHTRIDLLLLDHHRHHDKFEEDRLFEEFNREQGTGENSPGHKGEWVPPW